MEVGQIKTSQEEYFLFANCKTPSQQASCAGEWIENYAKTFTSRYDPNDWHDAQ